MNSRVRMLCSSDKSIFSGEALIKKNKNENENLIIFHRRNKLFPSRLFTSLMFHDKFFSAAMTGFNVAMLEAERIPCSLFLISSQKRQLFWWFKRLAQIFFLIAEICSARYYAIPHWLTTCHRRFLKRATIVDTILCWIFVRLPTKQSPQ